MSTQSISREGVLHLAKLAGLTLTDAEVDVFASQFGETIAYIHNLDTLDTSEVQPTNSVVSLSNVTFEDGTQNSRGLTPDEVFLNKKNGHFAVNRIME